MPVRALIDPAAESSFVTQHVAQSLHLPGQAVHVSIAGVGGTVTQIATREVQCTLQSKIHPDFFLPITALVLKTLTTRLPSTKIAAQSWDHLQGIQLADPNYTTPGRIDAILAADVYAAIMQPKIKRGALNTPIAQGSSLGWLVMGPAGRTQQPSTTSVFHTSINAELSQALQRFWEVEEVPKNAFPSPGDIYCEKYFASTVHQKPDGRYEVRLPFCQQPDFPRSRHIAQACFLRLERRFARQPQLAADYRDFMQAYIDLGHMKPMHPSSIDEPGYYIPHHAVYKANKIRVVFNASQEVENGLSLNACLHPGPKIQDDLPIILTRWRFLKHVFVADIIKMYRQFMIHPEDAKYQRILWRFHLDEPITDFQLLTVTYGTASAQYLAIKALLHLAGSHSDSHPKAAATLQELRYVDDIFAGADNESTLQNVKAELVNLLRLAQLELGKWSSNSPACFQEACNTATVISINLEECTSTLGLNWKPASDSFIIKVSAPATADLVTKRTVSSTIAKLYDPLGLLAPVTIQSKLMLQLLWIKGLDWDAPLDQQLLDS